jgi:hypothetical protein
MAHVLAMATVEFRHPVVFLVLVEADDTAFHRIPRTGLSRRALRPGTILRNRIRP